MWRARIHSLIARALITLALLESAWLVYPIVRRHVLAIEDTPAARGRRVAAALGCFGCHGPEGNGGVRNPGSEEAEVIWAITTRVDPVRDTLLVESTPIDYLDFASPVSGLGSKMGIDATNKWPGETMRDWGTPIRMSDDVKSRVDALWSSLKL